MTEGSRQIRQPGEVPASPGEVAVSSDAAALAASAAQRLVAWLAEALAERGQAHVAMTGGSSATGLYRALRELRADALDWSHVHLWWGDDRYVPLDHPHSNAGTAYAQLGIGDVADAGVAPETRLAVPTANVHPVPTGEAIRAGGAATDAGGGEDEPTGAARAAERYAAEIRAHLPLDGESRPIFDVILLGMGPDGHILSVFPGSAALGPGVPVVMPIPAPSLIEPHVARVTLTPAALDAAHHVLVMVSGAAKAEMINQVLRGERDPSRWPAQLAVIPQATWLLDSASAAELDEVAEVGNS
ncbi:MAG: 6-phosphogluconolactonase [Chloroflexota bacterium]|nr:6-phosphogluconolactonase [Chloroflexota bacterium]